MKTLWIQNQIIINISVGEPSNDPPTGIIFHAVPDDEYVDIGWTWDGENLSPLVPDA